MSDWIRVADAADNLGDTGREVIAGGKVIALFQHGDQWHAVDGVCPHQGGPLAEGCVVDCIVTCPWHGWQYDIRTGQHQINPNLRHTTYPVRVEDGGVWIQTTPVAEA
ncbi:MAG: Rieske (2Fe-2S) protein [Planctomycetales bacterium]|nr:Rieske (2Fe-2S) protein [Planctomycetales bacterium]